MESARSFFFLEESLENPWKIARHFLENQGCKDSMDLIYMTFLALTSYHFFTLSIFLFESGTKGWGLWSGYWSSFMCTRSDMMNDEWWMINDAAFISVVNLCFQRSISKPQLAEAFSLFSHRPGSQILSKQWGNSISRSPKSWKVHESKMTCELFWTNKKNKISSWTET